MQDVLVIGGGLAAICAALAAREEGASVTLVDRAPYPMRGGNTRHSRNLRVVHDHPLDVVPGAYSAQELRADLRAVSGSASPRMEEALAEGSRHLVGWLRSYGVAFEDPERGGIPWSRRTAFFLGGGQALMSTLFRRGAAKGVTIHSDSGVPGLPAGQGPPRTVPVHTAQGKGSIEAKAVVAACGGYPANPERLAQTWGEAAHRLHVRGTPYAHGEVLGDLLHQGAAPSGEPGACHMVAVDARSPGADGGIVTRMDGMAEGIVVDSAARRFVDESTVRSQRRYSFWGQQVAHCPGQKAFLILDHTGLERIPPTLYPPIEADSVGELGHKLGLDPKALVAEVGRYNEAAQRARDTGGTAGLDPPRERLARPLHRPPFGGYPVAPGITFTTHGVRVDERARILGRDGAAWEGIYAAGMIMAPTLLGTGYIAGSGMTVGAVFGRIAGKEAAGYARKHS